MTTGCVLLVAAHDEEARIAACLDAARGAPLPTGFAWRTWVVVDDGSTDDTTGMVRAWAQSHDCPPVDVIRLGQRQGKGAALQRVHRDLVESGHLDEVVVAVDADVTVEPQAFAALLGPLADRSVATVWGVGAADGREWGRRASAFQLLVTEELAKAMGPEVGRAAGALFAYRVGLLVDMNWRAGMIHDDLQLASFLRHRALPVRSVWTARVRVTPARGYRDFYLQTYRHYAAQWLDNANSTAVPDRIPRQRQVVAIARAARADPVGAAAYVPARIAAAAIHRLRPVTFADAWQQARSTKDAPSVTRHSRCQLWQSHLGVVRGSVLAFRNWPVVLAGIVGNRMRVVKGHLRFVTRDGLELRCPSDIKARAPMLEVFAKGIYHLERLPAPSPNGSWKVLDVGAHVGAFALHAVERLPGAEVTCYEPSPESFRVLTSNVRRNGLSARIRLHPVAVGSTDGRALLYEDGPGSCTNSLVPIPGAPGRAVAVVSFAGAVAEAGGRVDLVKLDCEGAEYDIVLGSPRDIWRGIGAVIMEYHPVAGRSPAEPLERLRELGFRMLWHEPRPDGLGMAAFTRADAGTG